MDGIAVTVARVVYTVAIAYFTFGAIVAILFATVGIGRIDPRAAGSTIGFRLAILPGAVCLWPILLPRWRAAMRGGPPGAAGEPRRRVRSRAWLVALSLTGLVLLAALLWRPPFPVQPPVAGTVPLSGKVGP